MPKHIAYRTRKPKPRPTTPPRSVPKDPNAILRLDDVLALVSVSKKTVYRWMDEGKFPRQAKLVEGGKAVGWQRKQVDQWLASRMAGA